MISMIANGLRLDRICLSLVVILVLSGCNSLSTDENDVGSDIVLDSIKYLLSRGEKPRLEGQALVDFPYALDYIRIADGPDAPLVLVDKYADGREFWVSSDRVGVVVKDGRIHQLLNTRNEVDGWRSSTEDPLVTMLNKSQASFSYRVDLQPSYATNLQAVAVLEKQGETLLSIGEQQYQTELISEVVKIPEINFNAKNFYWLDKTTGNVVRSIQYLPPEGTRVRLEVVKPYAP